MHSSAQGYADRSFSRVVDSIEGAVNLRDFGGYLTEDGRRVRTGVLYRSGDTHGLSAEGHSQLAVRLGIRTVVDLRTAEERAEGLSAFEAHGIATIHEPLRSSDGASSPLPRDEVMRSMALGTFDWGELYWNMLHLNADRFRRILELIARPDALPLLIHCAGGRDRTGVTAALVLLALGVRREHIAEDFALSSQLLALGAPQAAFDRMFSKITDIPRDDIVRAMATRAETMDALLARVRDYYGSTAGLFRMLDVPEALCATLRAHLLEPIG